MGGWVAPIQQKYVHSALSKNIPDPSNVRCILYIIITEIYDPFPCTSKHT